MKRMSEFCFSLIYPLPCSYLHEESKGHQNVLDEIIACNCRNFDRHCSGLSFVWLRLMMFSLFYNGNLCCFKGSLFLHHRHGRSCLYLLDLFRGKLK